MSVLYCGHNIRRQPDYDISRLLLSRDMSTAEQASWLESTCTSNHSRAGQGMPQSGALCWRKAKCLMLKGHMHVGLFAVLLPPRWQLHCAAAFARQCTSLRLAGETPSNFIPSRTNADYCTAQQPLPGAAPPPLPAAAAGGATGSVLSASSRRLMSAGKDGRRSKSGAQHSSTMSRSAAGTGTPQLFQCKLPLMGLLGAVTVGFEPCHWHSQLRQHELPHKGSLAIVMAGFERKHFTRRRHRHFPTASAQAPFTESQAGVMVGSGCHPITLRLRAP